MRLTDPQPRPRAIVAAAAVALLVLVSACSSASTNPSPAGGGGASQPSSSAITLSGLSFGVTEINVPAGDVSFVNKDSVLHLIAEGHNGTEAANPRFTKTNIAANATKVISFSAAGDYQITCLIHPTMNMVVHVQ